MMSSTDLDFLRQVLEAYDAGICTIPIKEDGSKKPAIDSWEGYQAERPSREQVEQWFGPDGHRAAAAICGPVSDGLVMVEMEGADYGNGRWQVFRDAAIERLGEDRWRQIVACVELSPSGGPHLYVRCRETTVGNLKLARRIKGTKTVTKPDGTTKQVPDVEVIMETRGKGGYTVIAGSVGHPTGNPWTSAQGGYDDIAVVTAEELHAILDAARTLDEMPQRSPQVTAERPRASTHDGDSIFDAVVADYNNRTNWADVLFGVAEYAYERNGVTYWHRIGSDNETGMTTNAKGTDTLIVFTTSTVFDSYDGMGPAPSYDRFGATVELEYGGDRTAAMRDLRSKGYGPQSDKPAPVPEFQAPPPVPQDIDNEPDDLEADEQPDRRVGIYWTDEVALDPPNPIDELVTNLIGIGEVTVFGAPRAMGKTWATMGLAADVANGAGNAFGSDVFRVTRPGRVVYMQGELGLPASYVRWKLATGGRVPRIAEVFDRLRVKTTARRITQTADGVTWTDEESVAVVDDRLEPMLSELGAELLVVDPWATYFAGNENSNDEVEAAIDAITQMARRVGCAVWIVHHITAKASHGNLAEPEDLWRGASRLADAVSTRVTLLPHYTPAKARELGLDRFQARTYGDLHVLQRNGPPVPVVNCHLDRYRWEHWEPPNSDGGRPTDVSDEDVVRVIRAAGVMASKRDLLRALGVQSSAATDRSLDRLIQLGVVETGTGKRGATTYRVNETELP